MPTTLWITVENGFATLSFHDKFEIDLGRITPHSVGSAGTSRNRERMSEDLDPAEKGHLSTR